MVTHKPTSSKNTGSLSPVFRFGLVSFHEKNDSNRFGKNYAKYVKDELVILENCSIFKLGGSCELICFHANRKTYQIKTKQWHTKASIISRFSLFSVTPGSFICNQKMESKWFDMLFCCWALLTPTDLFLVSFL